MVWMENTLVAVKTVAVGCLVNAFRSRQQVKSMTISSIAEFLLESLGWPSHGPVVASATGSGENNGPQITAGTS